MWPTIIITATITAFLTVALASVLVILFLVPHIEKKVDSRLKQSVSEIERSFRERATSVFRSKKQIAKGIGELFTRTAAAAPAEPETKDITPIEPPVLDEEPKDNNLK